MSGFVGLNLWLGALSLISVFLACCLGSTALPIDRIIGALFGFGEVGDRLVIWFIRLPRALAAFFTGAALGLSGAALQGLLRNPLAEPGVLGVSASSALLASFSLYYGLAMLNPWVLPLSAILGAMTATALLVFASIRTASVLTLILIGVGLSSFAGALMSLMLNFAPNPFSLADMMSWMLGSVANRSFQDIVLALPFIVAGGSLVFIASRGLTALTLGAEAGAGIGLDVQKHRITIIAGTGLLTGASVSLAGAIGFVGIIAPHIIRPIVGYNPARTLLPSALLAGIIIVIADIIVRIMPTMTELKLGVVAALFGAPVFVWIIMNGRLTRG